MIDRSISTTLRLAKERLFFSETAALDAELLLMMALGVSRTVVLTWPNRQLAEQELQVFEGFLIRREAGEPVAYITGHKHFWTLELAVTKDVLIPRPDTEIIVEWVTKSYIDNHQRLEKASGKARIGLNYRNCG